MLDWARRWGVPPEALNELFQLSIGDSKKPEAVVQARVRLEAARDNCILWRNNVGAVNGENGFIRYGLANESAQMNKHIKSSDLIGIRKVEVTQEMIGKTIGQFVAYECKRSGWNYTGNAHEQAQLRFLTLVAAYGGEGKFRS